MSINKETANYGELKVQLTSCMKEIKYEGTDRETDYNISKFAQILIGNEYIKKLREKHREEEWEDFGRLYVKRVLEVYAPKNRQDLLFSINGFSEEYCKLGIGARYKKYAGEIKLSTKTVRNWEDEVIDEVVKKLLNEIQEYDRHELKLLADEVFAELDSTESDDEINEHESETPADNKPAPISLPDDPEVTGESSDKQGKVLLSLTQTIKRLQKRLNIAAAVMAILVAVTAVGHLHDYLSTRMAGNEENAAPLIEDILVITPEITLYPGKEGLIQLDISPDGADIDSVNCIPDDSRVATVAHRIVTAQAEWQEENHETQITVQGGVSPQRQVQVTVLPDPKEQFTGADRPDGKPKGNEGKEDEQ